MKLIGHWYYLALVVLVLFTLFTIHHSSLITPAHAAYPNCVTNDPDWRCVIGGVNDPTGIPGNNGDEQISNFLSLIVRLIFIGGALVFVFMILLSAFQWIISGGDKEAITKARQRLVNAIIGLILLSLSFLIINIIGNVTGIGILKGGRNGIIPFAAPPADVNRPQQPVQGGPF